MTNWIRFRHQGKTGFGTLTQSDIAVHDGEMFGASRPSGQQLALGDVELLAPTVPSKIVALWNYFHALAAKLKMPEPAETLYLLKAPSSVTAPGAVIQAPSSYDGKQAFNAPRQQTASDKIPIASDARPRHISRGFLPWRFAYAGPGVRRATIMGRHPKTFTTSDPQGHRRALSSQAAARAPQAATPLPRHQQA